MTVLSRTPWMVVRVRHGLPPEVFRYLVEADAVAFYEDVVALWSNVYLCKVERGPWPEEVNEHAKLNSKSAGVRLDSRSKLGAPAGHVRIHVGRRQCGAPCPRHASHCSLAFGHRTEHYAILPGVERPRARWSDDDDRPWYPRPPRRRRP